MKEGRPVKVKVVLQPEVGECFDEGCQQDAGQVTWIASGPGAWGG